MKKKRKQLLGLNVNALDVFKAAACTEDASAILNKEILVNNLKIGLPPNFVSYVPIVVSNALSVELYLKCLLKIDYDGWPNEHNHKNLFTKLGIERQKEIKNYHQKYVSTDPFQITRFVSEQKTFGTSKVLDFDSQLESGANHFVKWRYWFDDSSIFFKGGTIGYPNTVAVAVREDIAISKYIELMYDNLYENKQRHQSPGYSFCEGWRKQGRGGKAI